MKNTITYILLLFLTVILSVTQAAALTVDRVEFVGNTVNLELDALTPGYTGEVTRKDIDHLAVRVTRKYHEAGYTTSYVDRMELTEEGTLRIYVQESRIQEVRVRGIKGETADELRRVGKLWKGEVYNRNEIRARLERLKGLYNLRGIRLDVENYREQGDVTLVMKVDEGSRWWRWGLGIRPLYGISPHAMYTLPVGKSFVEFTAHASYMDDRFTRAGGAMEWYHFSSGKNPLQYYAGVEGGRKAQKWETLDSWFAADGGGVYAGTRMYRRVGTGILLIPGIEASGSLTRIRDYPEEEVDNRMGRAGLRLTITRRGIVLPARNVSSFTMKGDVAASTLEPDGFVLAEADGKLVLPLTTRVRLIPEVYSYYTSSRERYYRRYVYDEKLLGFGTDYTASSFKNTGGLHLEFEVSPAFFYVDPFVNSGYFRDENHNWSHDTGAGLKVIFNFKKVFWDITYAWDVSETPAKTGRLYFMAYADF
ncbi:MAG: POTRA domain-containing protein [Spirochaetota bacterium]